MVASSAMSSATSECIPAWIYTIQAERVRAKVAGVQDKALGYHSDCQVGSSSVISCEPEVMRARTETRIKSLGLYPRDRRLTLDAYTIARNIKSEAGNDSIAEKVLIAQAAITRSRVEGKSISHSRLTMRNGRNYAKQSGTNPAVATSHDPTWEEIVIAEMALHGTFGDFGRGGTLYFSPNDMGGKSKVLEIYERWTHNWGNTKTGLAWVGPLPGVNPRHQFLLRKVPILSKEWKDAYAAGKLAVLYLGVPATALARPCREPEAIAVKTFSAMGFLGWLMIGAFFGGSAAIFTASYFGAEAASGRGSSRRRI